MFYSEYRTMKHFMCKTRIKFCHEIADMYPWLSILIYHNPENHKFTIPVPAFKELIKKPNIIGMKDSQRTTQAFMNLQKSSRVRLVSS